MLTSVILVNYKSSALLIDCLKSIYQFSINNLEIIVVENGSNDDVQNELSTLYPAVIFIQMGYNAGFARANNAGIRIAKGDFILLLNSDTIILNDAINKCSTQFEATNYVACGVQLLNADQTPQISGNFAMKGGLNYLLPIPFFGDILKSIATLIKIKKPNIPEAKGTEFVDWINGAFLMARKQTINAAGLLDEDFFLYAEEAEWCSRLKKHGKLCIFGDINVLHLQGATANVAFGSTGHGYQNLFDKKGFQIILSNFVRIRKEFGVFWFLIMLFFYFIAIPVFLIGLSFSTLVFFKNTGLKFKHWLGYSKNVCRLILYSVRIIINQPYFYKAL